MHQNANKQHRLCIHWTMNEKCGKADASLMGVQFSLFDYISHKIRLSLMLSTGSSIRWRKQGWITCPATISMLARKEHSLPVRRDRSLHRIRLMHSLPKW